MELIRAAELFIEKVEKDYQDDIALVVVMGSYIYGETHSRSDLDMFYVPKTSRGHRLGFTFILEERGFDYWPISWERLERIANYEERTTSIITEGRMLFCASESDRERFDALKAKAMETGDGRRFLHRAAGKLNEAYKDYHELLEAKNLADARRSSIGIVHTVTYALALLNRITVKRGRGKLKKEILDMPLVPEDFPSLYDAVFFGNEIGLLQTACGRLIGNTEKLILRERDALRGAVSFVDELGGYYEEMINFYNKIYHACEIGDAYTALFASVDLTYDIARKFQDTDVSTEGLPDMVGAYDPGDLERLAAAARKHQARFIELLTGNGIRLREFGSFDELREYLASL